MGRLQLITMVAYMIKQVQFMLDTMNQLIPEHTKELGKENIGKIVGEKKVSSLE